MITILDYKIISTGSKGNAVRIEDVMIDCGVPYKAMKEELYHCKYLLITHRHSDHVNKGTIKKIKQMFPHIKVLANADVAYSYEVDVIVNDGYQVTVGNYTFHPFHCPHDVNAPCTGYVWEVNGHRVIYATDTNSLKNAPEGPYDYLFLESNHDAKKILNIKDAYNKYGYDVIEGALRHLSKQQCKEFYYLHRRSRESELIELHQSNRFY